MFRGLFITGTDTDVGKTTVAAALMHRYRRLKSLKYWKPIQTGIELSDDQLERLNNLTPAVGERHDEANMAAIDR